MGDAMSGNDLTNLAWLLAAIAISTLVTALAMRASRPLAHAIGTRVSPSAVTPSQTRLLARLLMCGVALVATQAILRRPVALVLGGDRSWVPIDAGIAAGALAAVLLLLVLVYQTARPLVQALTLQAIDAAVPTVGAVPDKEPTRTSVSVVREPTPAPTDAVTVVAPLVLPPREADATVARPRTDAAVARPRADGQTTLRAGRPDDEPTIVAQAPDDLTLRVRRA
jgi:hypothetical protein